jgi:hypothetical protein
VLLASDRPVLGTPGHSTPDATSFGQIADGMVTYWRQLAAHGTKIVGIEEAPEPKRNIPDCLSRRGASPADCTTSPRNALIQHTPISQAVAAMGKGAAHLVDMNSLICGPTSCDPIVGNVTVYRDTHHLTATYVRTLQPYFEQQLVATGVFTSQWGR